MQCLPQDVDTIREAPAEGVYVHGLFLDGCAWSTKENRLVDSEPKKLFHPLPVLLVTAVLVSVRHETLVADQLINIGCDAFSVFMPQLLSTFCKAAPLLTDDYRVRANSLLHGEITFSEKSQL
jgi:hypothetical protein